MIEAVLISAWSGQEISRTRFQTEVGACRFACEGSVASGSAYVIARGRMRIYRNGRELQQTPNPTSEPNGDEHSDDGRRELGT